MRPPRQKKQPSAARPARADWTILAVVLLYVAALVTMVAFNRYAFILKSVIVPVLLLAALLSGRFARFVNDWAVFLGAVVLFDFCRGLVFALTTHFELPMHLGYVIDWERWICGGAIAPVGLQHLRASLSQSAWLDRFFVLVYSSHFVFFLLFGYAIWRVRHDAFRTYAIAITVVMYVGLLFYFAVPTVPPWMAANDFLALPPIQQIVRSFYNLHLPTLLATFDTNPIAAMPSLHTALPTICAFLALRYLQRGRVLVITYTLLVWVAVIYLGEHYLVDVLAGLLLALVVYAGVYRWGAHPDQPPAASGREPQESWQMRPIAVALLLVAVGFGFGQLTARWIGPLPINRAFIERDLMGRSTVAHYYLGRLAFAAGDFAQAEIELTRSLDDLPDPEYQKIIRPILDSAHRSIASVAK